MLLSILSVPLLALLIGGAWYYHHCAAIIDAQLQGGPFRNSVNIYGAPIVLHDGDALSLEDIEAELRLSGFDFHATSNGLDVTPRAGS